MTQQIAERAVGVLHSEVQNFYARQMQLLDGGAVAAWARTFTEDGVFAANAHPEPSRGRDVIERAAAATVATLAERGVTRRHWLGMVHVAENADGTVTARSYAQILEIPRGGAVTVLMSTTCVDVLVRDGEDFLVRHREVARDDL